MERVITKRVYELEPADIFVMFGRKYYVKRIFRGVLYYNSIHDKHREKDQTLSEFSEWKFEILGKINKQVQKGINPKGVYFDKNRKLWTAQYYLNKRMWFIGRYDTKEEAAQAYRQYEHLIRN